MSCQVELVKHHHLLRIHSMSSIHVIHFHCDSLLQESISSIQNKLVVMLRCVYFLQLGLHMHTVTAISICVYVTFYNVHLCMFRPISSSFKPTQTLPIPNLDRVFPSTHTLGPLCVSMMLQCSNMPNLSPPCDGCGVETRVQRIMSMSNWQNVLASHRSPSHLPPLVNYQDR